MKNNMCPKCGSNEIIHTLKSAIMTPVRIEP
jgi:predicted nucleic-acid-binding Zn-ribbon protein